MVSEMTIAACCCQIWSFIQYLLWTWQWQPPNIHVVGVGFQFSTYSSVCRCDSSWDATKDTQTGGSQINDEPGRYMKEICSSPVHLVCKLFNITRGQNFSRVPLTSVRWGGVGSSVISEYCNFNMHIAFTVTCHVVLQCEASTHLLCLSRPVSC